MGRAWLNFSQTQTKHSIKVRSTVSTAQSEIVESMRMSEAANKRRKRRKHQFLNFFNFNQNQRKGESPKFNRNSRAASMVSWFFYLAATELINEMKLILNVLIRIQIISACIIWPHYLWAITRFRQVSPINHLIGQMQQTLSSHFTQISHQDPEMIEDWLWLTIIEGIISQTHTCKNPGPPASCPSRPQSSTRCQQRPLGLRPGPASITIISKCPVFYVLSFISHPIIPCLICVWFTDLIVSVYWILKSYQRSYNIKLRNINSRWSTFNKTSRDAKILQTMRHLWSEETLYFRLWKIFTKDRDALILKS